MSLIKTLAVLVVLMVCGATAFAGGYQINEQGARATGMGGAFVAQASDGSAIFFNPAGLAFQQGFKLLLGTTIIMPSSKFTGGGTTTDMAKQTFTPVNAYATYSFDNGLSVGIGVFNPYGLGTEWPNNWAGRQMSVKTDLQTWYFNPTIAYKFSDQFSIGVGVSYVTGSVKLKQRVTTLSALLPSPAPAANDGTVNLDGTGTGFNWNVGLLYKPTQDLSIGLSYRALTKIDFSGTAAFTDMAALGGPVPVNFFPGGTGKTTLPLPSSLFAGIAYNLTKDFTVEADFQYVGWKAYDQLKLDIPLGPTFPPYIPQPLQGPSTLVKNWDDGYLIRVGGEYRLEEWAFRAGFIYDKTPQPDAVVEPMLPDANRVEVTLGFGYMLTKNLSFNATYQYISFADRNGTISSKTALPTTIIPATVINGTYSNSANLIEVNLGYDF
jgi:long-chain fatty acid transport protein